MRSEAVTAGSGYRLCVLAGMRDTHHRFVGKWSTIPYGIVYLGRAVRACCGSHVHGHTSDAAELSHGGHGRGIDSSYKVQDQSGGTAEYLDQSGVFSEGNASLLEPSDIILGTGSCRIYVSRGSTQGEPKYDTGELKIRSVFAQLNRVHAATFRLLRNGKRRFQRQVMRQQGSCHTVQGYAMLGTPPAWVTGDHCSVRSANGLATWARRACL